MLTVRAPVLRLAAIATVVVTVAFARVPPGIVAEFAEGIGLTAVYGILAWIFVVPPSERTALVEVIRAHSFAAILKKA